jgi:intracellular septation protein
MAALKLWWSFLWRLTLLLFLLSFVLHPLAQALLLGANPEAAIKYRPTVAWALVAGLFWISGAASPRFVRLVLWGERLGLSDAQWLKFCRAIAVLYAVLAIANVVVVNTTSTDTWVQFKLFAPFPLLLVVLIPLSVVLSRAHAQSNSSSSGRESA